jgi:hypothetical protein
MSGNRSTRISSIPRKLAAIAEAPAFWESYLWEDGCKGRFPSCAIDLAVSSDASLRVEIRRDFDGIALRARDVELASDSAANGCPDVLRWMELEVVCRAIALRRPELAHPGLPLRLLARFAPICIGDDLGAAGPMLIAAWGAAGASERVVRERLERHDRRADGFVWLRKRKRWSLEQRLPKGREPIRRAYGPRFAGNRDFPHDVLDGVIAAAQATLDDAIDPAWRKGIASKRARAAVKRRDLDVGDEIATLLRREGCRSHALLDALEGVRAARAWALELLLDAPIGSLVARFLGGDVPAVRPRAALELDLAPAAPLKRVVARLSKALRAADLGDAHTSGAWFSLGDDGKPFLRTQSCSITIRGDLEAAMALIRETLVPIPAGAKLRVTAPERRDVAL